MQKVFPFFLILIFWVVLQKYLIVQSLNCISSFTVPEPGCRRDSDCAVSQICVKSECVCK